MFWRYWYQGHFTIAESFRMAIWQQSDFKAGVGITFTQMPHPDDFAKHLNEPTSGGWCDRCRTYHAPRPVGEWDRQMKLRVKELADAIDKQALDAATAAWKDKS